MRSEPRLPAAGARHRRGLFLGLFFAAIGVPACTEVIVQKAPPSPEPTPTPTATEEPTAEPPPPSPPKDPLVVDLGAVKAGTDVTFDVPAGALGFQIQMEGEIGDFDPDRPFGIDRIVDPTGKVVHDKFTPNGGTKPTSTAAFDSIAVAAVPQGENATEVPAGKWTVRFGVDGGTGTPTVQGKVRIQSSGDGTFRGGTLDLHVHVPTGLQIEGATVDATKASADTRLKRRIDLFFQIAKQLIGFDRGEVVFHAEKASLAQLDDNEILDGFAVSAGTKDGTQSMHVLFTNAINQGGQPVAAGISPGIPGAAGIFGRNVSGIIVAPMDDDQTDALTMLHEMGHFIGLNHTTEFDGQSADPLSDTPRCTTIANQQLGSCGDRANVMFPAGPIAGPVALSPTQVRVYRGSPVYKALTSPSAKTMSFAPPPSEAPSSSVPMRVRIRRSGSTQLSPVERELSMGFCGLTKIDGRAMAARLGEAAAVSQLRAAAADSDLAPYVRGRARIALQQLGASP
ncbi:MAG: hypothetical protein JST00_44790 [Deltaproteobacteria bacterium]|nr:hypothetical protein [Deltaproteobacteria bacterium]